MYASHVHVHVSMHIAAHSHSYVHALTCINTRASVCAHPPHRHACTHTRTHRCPRPYSPSQAVGRMCSAAPLPVALPSFRLGSASSACSPPPSSFRWLFSPLPPGCKPIRHCLPRTLGLGTCCSPGWQPWASSIPRALLFLQNVFTRFPSRLP